jgi:hypothetical protein
MKVRQEFSREKPEGRKLRVVREVEDGEKELRREMREAIDLQRGEVSSVAS